MVLRPELPEAARLRVGLDLDGCFFDFAGAYYDACVRMGRIEAGGFPPPALTWEFYLDHGHDLDTFLANCHAAADAGLLWAGPVMPGGADAWNTLWGHGYELHVKTDRAFGVHPIASEVATRMWLGHHRLRAHTITFGPDKTQGPHVDVMLEDKLSNYDALDAAGVQVWLMDRPWNQDPGDARRRVYTHDEFVRRCDAFARVRDAAPAGA